MRKTLVIAGMALSLMACSGNKEKSSDAVNPFFTEYATPFGVPPFDEIKLEHYKPAFLKGMEEQAKEIDAIVNARSMPDFENTIVALDQSGQLLRRVSAVFYGLNLSLIHI